MPGMRRSRRRYYSRDDATPLITAVLMSREEPVKGWARLQKAVQSHPNPDDHDTDGFTALMYAVRLNLAAVIPVLVQAGATVDLRDEDGNTPFFYSCMFRYWEVMLTLIKLGADPDAHDEHGLTALLAAIDDQDEELVHRLLELGASPNSRSSTGVPPLIMALSHKHRNVHMTILRRLLEAQADVNLANSEGITPLMVACHSAHRHTEVVKMLIHHGARVDLKDLQGRTAVHFYLRVPRNLQCLRLLLKAEASPNVVDRSGATPLGLVAYNIHKSLRRPNGDLERLYLRILNELLTYGADPNMVTCKTNPNYVMSAVLLLENSQVAARALLAAGAEPAPPTRCPESSHSHLASTLSSTTPPALITALDRGNMSLATLLVDGLFYTPGDRTYIAAHFGRKSSSNFSSGSSQPSPGRSSERCNGDVGATFHETTATTTSTAPGAVLVNGGGNHRTSSPVNTQLGAPSAPANSSSLLVTYLDSPQMPRSSSRNDTAILTRHHSNNNITTGTSDAEQIESAGRVGTIDNRHDTLESQTTQQHTQVSIHRGSTTEAANNNVPTVHSSSDLDTLVTHLSQNTPSLQQLCRRAVHGALGCRRDRILSVRQLPIWAKMQRYIFFQGREYQT